VNKTIRFITDAATTETTQLRKRDEYSIYHGGVVRGLEELSIMIRMARDAQYKLSVDELRATGPILATLADSVADDTETVRLDAYRSEDHRFTYERIGNMVRQVLAAATLLIETQARIEAPDFTSLCTLIEFPIQTALCDAQSTFNQLHEEESGDE
jgi:hypothetical protein